MKTSTDFCRTDMNIRASTRILWTKIFFLHLWCVFMYVIMQCPHDAYIQWLYCPTANNNDLSLLHLGIVHILSKLNQTLTQLNSPLLNSTQYNLDWGKTLNINKLQLSSAKLSSSMISWKNLLHFLVFASCLNWPF